MVENTVFQDLNVQTPEVSLYARVAGNLQSGNALVAIHGGPGCSTNPGNDPANFTLIKYVEDLEAVRAAAGIERVFIMGHS